MIRSGTRSSFIFIFVFILFPIFAFAEEIVDLSALKNYSRIALRIDESTPVELKETPQGFEIFIKGLSLTDLGAPVDPQDLSRWKSKFETIQNFRLKKIEFSQIDTGVKVLGQWKFPVGEQQLAYPSMEVFSFREKSPSRFVLDFWVKGSPTLAQEKNRKIHEGYLEKVRKQQEIESDRHGAKREIARPSVSPNGLESQSYCSQKISSKNDIFLEFQPVHQKVDFTRWFPNNVADADFPYYKPRKKTREAQFVRLALKLYNQGKLGLVIRALDFFETEFAKSDFLPEMRFLRANTLIKLGFDSGAEEIFKKLITDSKDSPVALHSAMYLTEKLIEKNLPLSALENFLWLIQYYPNHSLNWVFHLGAAECLYVLRQSDRATKEYQWVIDHAPGLINKAEGSFRLADLYQARFQYGQALAAYSQGLNYFGRYAKSFPALYLNKAEALYQLGLFDRSTAEFKSFLDNFGNFPEGWRATFRLGETLAKNATSPEMIEESRQWYIQTINMYPYSPGATLARIRLAPCGDHGGFNLFALERFFNGDAKELNTTVFSLKKYEEFRALAHIRTLTNLGTDEQTVNGIVKDLKSARSESVRKIMNHAAHQYFRKVILELLESGKKFQALTFYNLKASQIPQSSDEFLADYLLKLSVAAADLGLENYSKKLQVLYEAKIHPKAGKNIITSEILASDSVLDNNQKVYLAARGLWINSEFDPNQQEETEIRMNLQSLSEDSDFLSGKEVILGLIEEKKGNYSESIFHASRANLLLQSSQMEAWLAELERKAGNLNASLAIFRNLEKKFEVTHSHSKPRDISTSSLEEELGVPPAPTLEQIILSQATLLESQKRWGEAAAAYARAVNQGLGGDHLLYEYARNLLKVRDKSEQSKGREILFKLAESKPSSQVQENYWKKLASEVINNEKSLSKLRGNAKEGKK